MAMCPNCGETGLLKSDIINGNYCVYCYSFDEYCCKSCSKADYVIDPYTNGTKECPNCGDIRCAKCDGTDWHLIEKRPDATRDLYECDKCYNRMLIPH